MMKMYLHFGYEERILFEFWQTSSVADMVLAVFIVGSLGFLTEASTLMTRILLRRERKKNMCQTQHDIEISSVVLEKTGNGSLSESQKSTEFPSCSSQCPPSPWGCHPGKSKDFRDALCLPGTSKCPVSASQCYDRCREKCVRAKLPRYGLTHFAATIVFAYQTTLNIFLMLSFMTYNVWLCLAVIIGRVTGYVLLQML